MPGTSAEALVTMSCPRPVLADVCGRLSHTQLASVKDGAYIPKLEPSATPGSFPQVSRHLSKLFDSLCKLKFRLDADGKPLKFGLGMYSKEDEFVDFDKECDLSGQVSLPIKR